MHRRPSRLARLLPSLLILAFFGGFLVHRAISTPPTTRELDQGRTLATVQRLILDDYYREVGAPSDPPDTRLDALYDAALRGMVDALGDRYSRYFDPKAYAGFQKESTGKFAGLGMTVRTSTDGFVHVVTPILDTPAWRAGLRPGDAIETIDGTPAKGLDLQTEFIPRLSGAQGTTVTLGVRRLDGSRFSPTLTRTRILVPTIVDVHLVPPEFGAPKGTGYLRVTGFKERTAEDFAAAVQRLADKGARHLIIDLRFNLGGLLMAVEEMVDDLLPAEQTIIYTKGRKADYEHTRTTTDRTLAAATGWDLVLLVNRRSASASEVFAGALQDHQRALIVGETTLGKGLVQNTYALPNAEGTRVAGVKLTTARYFTPAGRCIQRDDRRRFRGGIAPDVKLVLQHDRRDPRPDDELNTLRTVLLDREVIGGPPWHDPGTAPPADFVDRQLVLAARVLSGTLPAVPTAQPNDHPEGSFEAALTNNQQPATNN